MVISERKIYEREAMEGVQASMGDIGVEDVSDNEDDQTSKVDPSNF
jgi:hypothetical protein